MRKSRWQIPLREYWYSFRTDNAADSLVILMQQEDWRVPIGDSGTLELILDVLDVEIAKGTEANVELQVQTLRIFV